MVSDAHSFQTVATLWLAHWRAEKTERHGRDNAPPRGECLPDARAHPIAEIEAHELVAMVKVIEARGASDVAKRALETTGQIFCYGIAHGHAKRNLAADIRPDDILKPKASRMPLPIIRRLTRIKTSPAGTPRWFCRYQATYPASVSISSATDLCCTICTSSSPSCGSTFSAFVVNRWFRLISAFAISTTRRERRRHTSSNSSCVCGWVSGYSTIPSGWA
jgi:hypothetical protein